MIFAGRVFVEDVMETIVLPTLASCEPAIVRQQEEMAQMLYDLLAAQQRWDLVHLLVLKGAGGLQANEGGVPAPVSYRLAQLDAIDASPPAEGQVGGPD